MLKSEFIERLNERFPNQTLETLNDCVNLLLDLLGDTLSKGERIEIRGFGSFSVRHYAPRQARNPKTGKRLMTQETYRIHFKPGQEFREQLNQQTQTLKQRKSLAD